MRPLRDPSRIIRRSARRLYGTIHSDWPPLKDGWNDYKFSRIEQFVIDTGYHLLSSSSNILDAGCGIGVYEWMPSRAVNLDLCFTQIHGRPNAVVSDLEHLPFRDGTFDLIFCIGSVLNYVSALEALNELSRVIAASGRLYLHFETSSSFEHIFKHSWNAPAFLNKTVNASRSDYIWIYSPNYIFKILNVLGFKIVKTANFHILSTLLGKLGMPQKTTYKLAHLDRVVPWLNFFADDIIILAEKT
jgi:SAM-dependent methyltransferase